MSNYVKATDFAVKDGLSTGNPLKVVKGTEIDTEFNNIATAISTKADLASPTFTGTPAAPTASSGTNTTQVATTAFVTAADTAAITAERTAAATLTNKTLTSPTINGGTISGITDLTVADGGTGVSSLTLNNVILGNGTSPVQFVAPGTAGNVLTSNGTTWTSAAGATGITTTAGSAPYYAIRAFVNFNASSGTPSIRNSQNVTSITDNGVGDFTINLTTAMPDANFTCASNTALDPASFNAQQLVRNSDCTAFPVTTSTLRFCSGSSGGSTVNDALWNEIIVIR